jgi:hypothetical protein
VLRTAIDGWPDEARRARRHRSLDDGPDDLEQSIAYEVVRHASAATTLGLTKEASGSSDGCRHPGNLALLSAPTDAGLFDHAIP